MREDSRRCPVPCARQDRRPEQRVEVDDVLADEVVDLGLAVGLPVAVEIQARPPAVLQQAREIADRRVEPDVEVLVLLAGNLEAEVGRVAGDVPVAQPRAEPLGQLGRDGGLEPARAGPFAQHRLEVAELEEQVLGFPLHRRRAAHHGDGVDEVGRCVGCPAGFAAVAVLVERAAFRAGAADVAVGQEHLRLLVVGLHDGLAADVARGQQAPVDLVGDLAVFRRVGRVEIVVGNVEGVEVAALLGADPGDQLLRRDAFLACLEHDRRAVRIARPDEQAVVPPHALEPHPDVGLDVLDHVAEVRRAVGVGQCGGDEQGAFGWGGHEGLGTWQAGIMPVAPRNGLARRADGPAPGVGCGDSARLPRLGKADTRRGRRAESTARTTAPELALATGERSHGASRRSNRCRYHCTVGASTRA